MIGTSLLNINSSARGGAGTGASVVLGYDGTLTINSSGLFVNGHGNAIQPRGANFSGLESQSVSPYWPTNAWGSQGGFGGPSWPAYQSWKPNIVRIPLNVAVWLNLGIGILTPASGVLTCATTAATSGGTTLTVSGATSGMNGLYLVDCTPGGSGVTGVTVTYVNSTTLTTSASVTVASGHLLAFVSTATTAVTPAWTTATTTAGSTSSTTITVASATSALTGSYLFDTTGGSTIPSGTTVTYATSTTYTTSNPVTIASGHVLNFQVAGDPNGTYKSQVLTAINNARAIGCYVILDAHWAAPKFTFNGITNYMSSYDQPFFMDYDTTYPFWTAGAGAGPNDVNGNATTGIVAWLQANGQNVNGNINDIIFECFNEPYLDQQSVNCNSASGGGGSSQTNAYTMLNGGYCSGYANQYNNAGGRGGIGCPNAYCGVSGQPGVTTDQYIVNYWWRVAGYQAVVTGIRTLGATNIIQVNCLTFTSKLSMFSSIYPTDSLSPPQISCGMHSYQSGSTNYPGTGDTGSGTSSWHTYVDAVIGGTSGVGHAVPVLFTEFGNANNTGSGVSAAQPDTFMSTMETYFDSQTTGAVGSTSWQWDYTMTYGYTGTTSWAETIFSAVTSMTGGVSNGSGSSGNILNVTAVIGTPLVTGMVISGGALDRGYITGQLTGTTGGIGTYTMSYSVYVAAGTTLSGQTVLPLNGQGQTEYNWMVGHA